MPGATESLESLRAIIIRQFPELAAAPCTLLAAGWDSLAVDVDDRWIFKFPPEADAAMALRREAGLLELVRGVVTLPVPSLTLFETPRLFSRHAKIPGEHLVTAQYDALEEKARAALGETLGQFYAELHTISPDAAKAAGALPLEDWLPADEILRKVWPVLPTELRPFAETTLRDWTALPPDPLGQTYGFFDGHGWNMAFDHQAGRLNGIYDFADSGIGDLQEEFIFSNFISPDLTERIINSYEQQTGRSVDRDRVHTLTGAHRLWELAVDVGGSVPASELLENVTLWARTLSTG